MVGLQIQTLNIFNEYSLFYPFRLTDPIRRWHIYPVLGTYPRGRGMNTTTRYDEGTQFRYTGDHVKNVKKKTGLGGGLEARTVCWKRFVSLSEPAKPEKLKRKKCKYIKKIVRKDIYHYLNSFSLEKYAIFYFVAGFTAVADSPWRYPGVPDLRPDIPLLLRVLLR